MKFGTCISVDNAIRLFPKDADYVELSATEINALSKEQFSELKKATRQGDVITYSCNCLVPGDLRLCGENMNIVKIKNYCDEAFAKMAEIGISTLVFGSGRAKQIPDGFSRELAWQQLIEVGTVFSECASKLGQRVVIEPLSYNEVNVINTFSEAVRYARNINKPNVGVLVDFYHFYNNKEDIETLNEGIDLLWHTHFSVLPNRTLLTCDEDGIFLSKCIDSLKKIGYTGAMSYEGLPNNPGDELDFLLREMHRYGDS